jgi:hypothetical protein
VVGLAEIVRGEGPQYLKTHFTTPEQRKAIHDIACCKTAEMGTVKERCDRCQIDYWLYCSCRNRHCPLCGGERRRKWVDVRRQEILPVPYLQVVFTVPAALNVLAWYCPRQLYDIVIHAAGQAVTEVGWSELNAQLGCQTHLQTWTQSMAFDLHTHGVVPCGGLSEDGKRWVSLEPDHFPVKTLSNRFRSIVCEAVRAAAEQGDLDRLPDSVSVERLLWRVSRRQWKIYAEPPFQGPERLLAYLSRVAITNDRIESYENGQVTFRGRDSQLYTLDAQEFLRRLLMHIVPKRFVRVRSYGFLANRNHRKNLQQVRQLIGQTRYAEPSSEPLRARRLCPPCFEVVGSGPMPPYAPSPKAASQLAFPLRAPPIPSVAA